MQAITLQGCMKDSVLLIKRGLAYVDDQTTEEISATRGNVTTPE